ncbi:MAG: hypothetical protein K2Q01_04465 [Rickettsiales bacterium]|nr:hypothetical protein [Rickettsiales bacterium]
MLRLYQVIHASGNISEGTTENLRIFAQQNRIEPGGEIYLDSRGGNRLEAMRLGRLIRQLGLMTHIGRTEPQAPGACISACPLAYLGGQYRFMQPAATFGVHRFYRSQREDQEFTLEQAPQVAQDMQSYIQEMNADPALYRYMTLEGQSEVVQLSKETLQGLKIVNDGINFASWTLTEKSGVPYMEGTISDYQGTHGITLFCDRHLETTRGVVLQFTGRMQTPDPESLARLASAQGVKLGEQILPQTAQITREGKQVAMQFSVPPELALRMAQSASLGMYVKPQGVPFEASFSLPHNRESSERMTTYVRNCFGSKIAP